MYEFGSLRMGTAVLPSLDLGRRLGRRKRRRIGSDRTNRPGGCISQPVVHRWRTELRIKYAECHEFMSLVFPCYA